MEKPNRRKPNEHVFDVGLPVIAIWNLLNCLDTLALYPDQFKAVLPGAFVF